MKAMSAFAASRIASAMTFARLLSSLRAFLVLSSAPAVTLSCAITGRLAVAIITRALKTRPQRFILSTVLSAPPLQVSLHEGVQRAIHHAYDIARLVPRPMVLH